MRKTLIISLKTISFLLLGYFLVGLSLWLYIEHPIRITSKEEKAVDYIIENIDEFQDDFKAMRYDAKIAYVLDADREDDVESIYFNKQTELGSKDDRILLLCNDNREYRFDVGFDCFKRTTDKGTKLSISKNHKEKVLKLKHLLPDYYVKVSLYNEEIKRSFGRSLNNDYELNFINYFVRNGDDEYGDDKIIKEHISAEELCKIYEECIALQDKLVEVYEEHKKL